MCVDHHRRASVMMLFQRRSHAEYPVSGPVETFMKIHTVRFVLCFFSLITKLI